MKEKKVRIEREREVNPPEGEGENFAYINIF
jgi:hypothetical protein